MAIGIMDAGGVCQASDPDPQGSTNMAQACRTSGTRHEQSLDVVSQETQMKIEDRTAQDLSNVA